MISYIIQLGKPVKVYMLLVCALLLITACKKGNSSNLLSGKYNGKYYWDANGVVYYHGQSPVTIAFAGNSYTSSDSNGQSSGNYVLKKDSITFIPQMIAPGTAQGSIVALIGTYQYHNQGDSLIITKSYLNLSNNQYRLKRN